MVATPSASYRYRDFLTALLSRRAGGCNTFGSSSIRGLLKSGSPRSNVPLLAEIQGLLAEEPPRWWKSEICAHEQTVLRQPALGRVRDESGYDMFGGESSQLPCLGQALFSERGLVVDEVPIRPAYEPDVGLKDEHTTPGPQERPSDAKLLDHSFG